MSCYELHQHQRLWLRNSLVFRANSEGNVHAQPATNPDSLGCEMFFSALIAAYAITPDKKVALKQRIWINLVVRAGSHPRSLFPHFQPACRYVSSLVPFRVSKEIPNIIGLAYHATILASSRLGFFHSSSPSLIFRSFSFQNGKARRQ